MTTQSAYAVDSPAGQAAECVTIGAIDGGSPPKFVPASATNPLPVAPTASAKTTVSPAGASYVASLVLKNSAGRLHQVGIFNSGPAQWFMLFDAAALPANGTQPNWAPIYLSTNGSGGWDFGSQGLSFANGIVVGNSTTGASLTTGANDSVFSGQVGAA